MWKFAPLAFACAVPCLAQAQPITDLAPGFYPGGGTGVPAPVDWVKDYLARYHARIGEITADVVAVRSNRIRGGCIGQTYDVCVASLAQTLIITTDAKTAQFRDELLDPPEVDVNGKAIGKLAMVWAFDPRNPTTRPMLISMNAGDDGKVHDVMFTLSTDPELARTEAQYDSSGVYDVAETMIDPKCLGSKLDFYRFLENKVKAASSTSRDIDTGPGSAKDFYHSSGEAVECGYTISLASEVGVDTDDISTENPSGTSKGAHLSFKANGVPQTPDYGQLFIEASAVSPSRPTVASNGSRPVLGVDVSDPPGISRMMLGYKGGALVYGLKRGSVAQTAGIHWGDVLLTFNGQPIPSGTSLPGMVADVHVGDKVEITLYRNRTKMTVQAQF